MTVENSSIKLHAYLAMLVQIGLAQFSRLARESWFQFAGRSKIPARTGKAGRALPVFHVIVQFCSNAAKGLCKIDEIVTDQRPAPVQFSLSSFFKASSKRMEALPGFLGFGWLSCGFQAMAHNRSSVARTRPSASALIC